ncbi:hypothetical protein L596_002263 [Steinernema carpocapsae]|uniref:Uncharacterized protein n=1 Tax=Steinernema carpocapsae TaxID=34508 RepID=A0A4U8UP73_STECR|nr:hypothetical protein L596_002263 [Steinernema carpocapsae]
MELVLTSTMGIFAKATRAPKASETFRHKAPADECQSQEFAGRKPVELQICEFVDEAIQLWKARPVDVTKDVPDGENNNLKTDWRPKKTIEPKTEKRCLESGNSICSLRIKEVIRKRHFEKNRSLEAGKLCSNLSPVLAASDLNQMDIYGQFDEYE